MPFTSFTCHPDDVFSHLGEFPPGKKRRLNRHLFSVSCNSSRRQQVAQLLCRETMDMTFENILVV
jgi:hypothetical protein